MESGFKLEVSKLSVEHLQGIADLLLQVRQCSELNADGLFIGLFTRTVILTVSDATAASDTAQK
jgi:hypothetical protein